MAGKRRLEFGADCVSGGGVHFRVWAPKCARVDVVFDDGAVVPLVAEDEGCFAGEVAQAGVGARYRYRLDGEATYADPASRFQPEGPHGPSEVIDPSRYAWAHDDWPGLAPPERRVLYELHVGTFTPAGSWRSAAQELDELARLGVNVVEVMPVADFVGEFGWGYDGVNLYAPTRLYGRPDDFRHFVDRAHALGIGVILDVVYNHFGPDGCYLRHFTDDFFSDRYENEWGDPPNFDGEHAGPVRAYYTANAAYWIEEFHLDGLRLDATQQMFDATSRHIIAEIVDAARRAAAGRSVMLVCENETQDAQLLRPSQAGGCGADALWNDDFHHATLVAATGRAEAYYSDYAGTAQELLACALHGFLYQGQYSRWQKKRRGTPARDLPPHAFVHYLENHDQVANSACGARLAARTSPGRYRALTTLLLLGPQTPMLFQGQEFASSRPFLYFADHAPTLAAGVRRGRAEFLAQFPSLAAPETRERLCDPAARESFEICKLDFAERATHAAAYALHGDLLRLRLDDPVLNRVALERPQACVLGTGVLVLRYAPAQGEERLLLLNLGRDLALPTVAEPLLAPPAGGAWRVLWSSEAPRYGGDGVVEVETSERFFIPGEAAVVLAVTPAARRAGPLPHAG